MPSCISVEMNGVLQNLIIEIARDNPAEHFVPTSSQWLIRGYKTAYRLGFPACFSCTMNGIANCTEMRHVAVQRVLNGMKLTSVNLRSAHQ